MRLISALVLAAAACAEQGNRPAAEADVPPPTAAGGLAHAREALSAGNLQLALGEAQAVVADFPGSAEADTASALIPEIRLAIQAEVDSARVRKLRDKWSYRSTEDPMSGSTARFASIESENEVSFDFPYEGAQRGTLTIRDHPSHGRDVLLSIRTGQFLCPSYDDCQIRIRFDEAAARTWNAVGPSDNSTTVIFIRNADRFLAQLRSAQVLRIQAEFYQEGQPIFEFHVGGFDHDRYRNQ